MKKTNRIEWIKWRIGEAKYIVLHFARDWYRTNKRKHRQKRWRHEMTRRLNKSDVLSVSQKEQVIDYFKAYTGKKISTVFHSFYTEKTSCFEVRYMPDDLYYGIIDPYFNDWDMVRYIDNKCFYNKLFPEIQQPETVAMRMGKFWLIPDEQEGYSFRYVDEDTAITAIEEFDCFIKQARESSGGHGVLFLPKASSREEIIAAIGKLNNDLIVQKNVIQCESLSTLNNSSVNTIRILSFLQKDGTVKTYSAILRMGINGSKVDNASSGGITCGIDEDGRLMENAYTASGKMYERYHPDSHVQFRDVVIPCYSIIRDIVVKTHPGFPHFRLISWDFAVDRDNKPVLIEANLHYGELDFHQLNNGPLFGNDTEAILKEVFQTTD